jgi:ATP-dependent DNA ligase
MVVQQDALGIIALGLAEVEYTEITPDGLVRHPSFKGLREDKPAGQVHLEGQEA